jgi:hypothetical protein
MSQKIIVLQSSNVGQAVQAGNTERLIQLLAAKKCAYNSVDGSDDAQKAIRDKLFGISGIRGNYPQIFKAPSGLAINNDTEDVSGVIFVGTWEKIEEMNEMNEIPPEVLEANPDIVTLNKTLSDCETV